MLIPDILKKEQSTLKAVNTIQTDGATKAELNTGLALKADLSTTYTKTEVDTALSNVTLYSAINNIANYGGMAGYKATLIPYADSNIKTIELGKQYDATGCFSILSISDQRQETSYWGSLFYGLYNYITLENYSAAQHLVDAIMGLEYSIDPDWVPYGMNLGRTVPTMAVIVKDPTTRAMQYGRQFELNPTGIWDVRIAANGTADYHEVLSTFNGVTLNTSQTISGVKTFSSSPIVPTPTADAEAATKKYVDDAVAAGGGGSPTVGTIWAGSQADYDALQVKNDNVMYITYAGPVTTTINSNTVWKGTQTAYESLQVKNPDTLYITYYN